MPTKVRYSAALVEKTAPFASMTPWAKWVFILLLGSSFGRTFYYLGVPQAKIFIGEVTLAVFALLRPRVLVDSWFRSLTERTVMSPFAWVLLVSILYGFLEVGLGLFAGYPPLTAIQNLVFNLYPVYFFLGLWVGTQYPTMLQKVVRWSAWMLAFYGPAYILFLHSVKVNLPGTQDVPLFPQAGGGGFFLLMLLALEPKPSRYWLPMVLAAAMELAVQVRGEWVATAVAFVIWGLLERRLGKMMQAAGLVVLLLVLGFITDLDLPSPEGRGGKISSREIIARGVSAINPTLAEDLTGSKNTGMYAGTISWRTRWWSSIRDSVSTDRGLDRALLGNGYGFPLKDLVPYLKGMDIRTPHSIFYYALGYSGWIGVALFFSLQAALLSMLWRVYELTGRSYGIALWTITLVTAFFGNSYEAPQGAIPFYLLMGLVIGPALCRRTVVLAAGLRRPALDWREASLPAEVL